MRRFLAVDGGNSKTDVVLGTDSGEVLAYVRGPGTCHQNIGLDEAMSRLSRLVAEASDPAKVAWGQFYLAGADLPEDIDALTTAVSARGWADTVHVDNDTFALLRAGSDARDAVAVVCGAGINGVGRTADGRTARFPSLGMVTGDWGGGGHLGLLALWHAARAEDGRGPATRLAPAIVDHCGVSTVADVSLRLHRGAVEPDWLASLAPVVFQVAAEGDPIAARIVARQADEIVTLATVMAGRLSLLDVAFAVVLGGGVLRARPPGLIDPILSALAMAAPKATVTVVDAPPVLGAALSALDALGAPAAAHAAVREALASRSDYSR
jgi:N-acetylglucosamine kinase-like BadF-type ATPase